MANIETVHSAAHTTILKLHMEIISELSVEAIPTESHLKLVLHKET